MPVSPPAADQVFSELRRSQLFVLRSRSGRLSGLLSGCPPTDTRPQARTKKGGSSHKRFEPAVKRKSQVREKSRCAASEDDGFGRRGARRALVAQPFLVN